MVKVVLWARLISLFSLVVIAFKILYYGLWFEKAIWDHRFWLCCVRSLFDYVDLVYLLSLISLVVLFIRPYNVSTVVVASFVHFIPLPLSSFSFHLIRPFFDAIRLLETSFSLSLSRKFVFLPFLVRFFCYICVCMCLGILFFSNCIAKTHIGELISFLRSRLCVCMCLS